MASPIIVRADGSARIGTGHVMRCLALAQAWRKTGGDVRFVAASLTPSLEKRLTQNEIAVSKINAEIGGKEDLSETIQQAKEHQAQWIVIDGYNFDARYEEGIKSSAFRSLVFDDFGHTERYCADYVLNAGLVVDQKIYPRRDSSTRLLLGPRYALLRKEFASWRTWQREISTTARKVLITLGGSDPNNVTGDIIRALPQLQIHDLEVQVLIGGSNLHQDILRKVVDQSPISIKLIVDASNIADLMAWADVAIAAAGTTAWELAFMGLPAVVLVLAGNQKLLANQLQEGGLARNLDWHDPSSAKQVIAELKNLLTSEQSRAEMSRSGRNAVDGFGSDRVCLHLREGILHFRAAAEEDCRLVWQWANDTDVRAASFSSKTIPWTDHVSWFNKTLTNPNCFFWLVVTEKDQPIGQVRFDLNGRDADISVALDRAQRGKELGALLIWCACRKFFRESGAEVIHAYVKPDNVASQIAFQKAGFEKRATTNIKGCAALAFELTRAGTDL